MNEVNNIGKFCTWCEVVYSITGIYKHPYSGVLYYLLNKTGSSSDNILWVDDSYPNHMADTKEVEIHEE